LVAIVDWFLPNLTKELPRLPSSRYPQREVSSDSRSAARLETWKEAGKHHRNDCRAEKRNTDQPRDEKVAAQKFFGKNHDG
jgi:hypothetical protein